MLTKIKKLFNKEESENTAVKEDITSTIGEDKISKKKENIFTENSKNDTANKTQDEALAPVSETISNDKPVHTQEEVKAEVIKVLKTCYDPEIPVDVWELGLIYDIKVATNNDVLIIMTLTSPSCPVAGILPGEIEQKVKDHPMVNDCKVQLTFDPPWSQQNMSEVAKLELGFL